MEIKPIYIDILTSIVILIFSIILLIDGINAFYSLKPKYGFGLVLTYIIITLLPFF